jgi:hypothetical protein
MLRSARFGVTVARADDGCWWVSVEDKAGAKYAETFTQDLETGLRMMVPYMYSAAQPDPFAAMLERALKTAT